MSNKIPFQWEQIPNVNSHRTKVFGGWLVVTVMIAKNRTNFTEAPTGVCQTFVPDPEHKWEIDNGV